MEFVASEEVFLHCTTNPPSCYLDGNDLNSTNLVEHVVLLFGSCEVLQTVGTLYSVVESTSMTEGIINCYASLVDCFSTSYRMLIFKQHRLEDRGFKHCEFYFYTYYYINLCLWLLLIILRLIYEELLWVN